jgi:hypothetical protein
MRSLCLLLAAFIAGCGSAANLSDAPLGDASAYGLSEVPLAVATCPWGEGQCAWPGTEDEARGFRVGGWKTGTGTAAKVQRSDLLAKFTMQGAAFVSEIRFSAFRDGAQDGSL